MNIQNALKILAYQLKCFDCLCKMRYAWEALESKISNEYKNIFECI